jgi:hypothetical protein
MYTNRVYLAISTIYPALCVVCMCVYDRWAILPRQPKTVSAALRLWPTR